MVVVGETAAVTIGDCVLPDIEAHGVQRVAPAADHPLHNRERWGGDTMSDGRSGWGCGVGGKRI